MVENWSSITLQSLQEFWHGFLQFLPPLIGSITVFVVGWFISVWTGAITAGILKRLRFDKLFEKTGWQGALEKADFRTSISDFIGAIVKWILIFVFLLAAVDILGISQFSIFLGKIVGWLPNLVVAVAIFVVAVIIADFSEKIVRAIVGKMGVGYAALAASVVKWSIWTFAILAILVQLGIAADLIKILVAGFVALIVISCGIAFGLGGKDLARDILEGLRNKLRS